MRESVRASLAAEYRLRVWHLRSDANGGIPLPEFRQCATISGTGEVEKARGSGPSIDTSLAGRRA